MANNKKFLKYHFSYLRNLGEYNISKSSLFSVVYYPNDF